VNDWTLADFRRHVPRIIAERDEARAENAELRAEVERLRADVHRDQDDEFGRSMTKAEQHEMWKNVYKAERDRFLAERDEARAALAASQAAVARVADEDVPVSSADQENR
jgi:hypothetical protein